MQKMVGFMLSTATMCPVHQASVSTTVDIIYTTNVLQTDRLLYHLTIFCLVYSEVRLLTILVLTRWKAITEEVSSNPHYYKNLLNCKTFEYDDIKNVNCKAAHKLDIG